MAHPLDRLAHFPRRRDDVHRQVDDVGVGPQLLDGGDAIGIDGDQAHAAFLFQAEVGGQLGDGGRLAHAGRPHQRRQAATAGRDRGSGRPRECRSSIMPATRALSIIGSESPSARGSLRTPLDQFAGDLLAQLGVEQFGEQAEQFLGPIVVAAALRPPAEVLHHRLQRAELALHLVRELAFIAGAAAPRGVGGGSAGGSSARRRAASGSAR